jgi:hypothetical protein
MLASRVFRMVNDQQRSSRSEVFRQIASLVDLPLENFHLMPRSTIPYLDEPWYC